MNDASPLHALGSLTEHPDLDSWIAFEHDGRVTVRTGKVELGQGIRTAFTIIAADELVVDPDRIDLASPTTGATPDEGYTAGSRSLERSGTAIRQACAHARRILLERAANKLGVPVEDLRVADGCVTTPHGPQMSYWELAGGRPFEVQVQAPAPTLPAEHHRWIGRGLPRVDLPAKISGGPAFLQDLRLPGMRYARVVRWRSAGSTLMGDVPATIAGADVVRRGNFVAVVADSEGMAVLAADALAAQLRWEPGPAIPAQVTDPDYMASHVVASFPIVDGLAVDDPPPPPLEHPPAAVVRRRYTKPFLLHGSIGPSAGIAHFASGKLSVWSHSQGIGFLRDAIADTLSLERDAVTVRHVNAAGCYGHNGADDAAFDAAVVATARPGEPVLLRWTRADEHGWEPLSPAMVVDLSAAVGADGLVDSWDQDITTYLHNSRPAPAAHGSKLLGSWFFDPPLERARATPMKWYEAGGHRNATPPYRFRSRRIVKHDVDDGSPLRTSAMRSLGALANVFATESFMDELAEQAGSDPLSFRLAHLEDPRARAVVERAVELAGGLQAAGGIDAPGRGLGYARYENSMAYVAVVMEVEVSARTGMISLRHAWLAADAGEIIDPDGLANQLEGGLVQAASWTLKEEVGFGADGVATRDWDSYPILRFSEVPTITTSLIDRPDERPLGSGEASCAPTAGAIGNAVFQATGVRLRQLPLRPERVRQAMADLL